MPGRVTAERVFSLAVIAALLAGGGFYAGRATAPVRHEVQYVPAAQPLAPALPDTPAPAAAPDADQGVAPVVVQDAPEPVQVWVNTKTHAYHMPGSRWYGNTQSGQYMSESDALAAGYHRSERG